MQKNVAKTTHLLSLICFAFLKTLQKITQHTRCKDLTSDSRGALTHKTSGSYCIMDHIVVWIRNFEGLA